MRELLEETKTTLETTDSDLYQQVRGEIQRAVEQEVSSDVPEIVSPTGRYLYHFETATRGDGSVIRQYRRVLADAHISEESDVADSPSPRMSSELVVELNVATSDLQAMMAMAHPSLNFGCVTSH